MDNWKFAVLFLCFSAISSTIIYYFAYQKRKAFMVQWDKKVQTIQNELDRTATNRRNNTDDELLNYFIEKELETNGEHFEELIKMKEMRQKNE